MAAARPVDAGSDTVEQVANVSRSGSSFGEKCLLLRLARARASSTRRAPTPRAPTSRAPPRRAPTTSTACSRTRASESRTPRPSSASSGRSKPRRRSARGSRWRAARGTTAPTMMRRARRLDQADYRASTAVRVANSSSRKSPSPRRARERDRERACARRSRPARACVASRRASARLSPLLSQVHRSEGVLPVYKYFHIGMHQRDGGGKYCPFDCDCCF